MRLWDIRSHSCIAEIEDAHAEYTYCCEISPKGSMVSTSGLDGKLNLWNLPTLERRLTLLDEPNNGIWCVRFSPSGNYLACSWVYDSRLFVFDTKSWKLVRTLECTGAAIAPLDFTHDELSIIATNEDVETISWELDSGIESWRCRPGDSFGFFAVSKDYPRFAIGGVTPNLILIKDSQSGATVREIRINSSAGGVATFVRQRQVLALGGSANLIRLIDIDTGSEIQSVVQTAEAITAVASSPNGRLLAWGTGLGKVVLADLREG